MNSRSDTVYSIGDQDLDLDIFTAVCRGQGSVCLGAAFRKRMERSNEFRARLAVSDRPKTLIIIHFFIAFCLQLVWAKCKYGSAY